jgi:DNA replicative helicase MCM subunit Mcm2 (Cdc46/Mcm family)
MQAFIDQLKELTGKDIRIYFYAPPNTASVRDSTYIWIGKIIEVKGNVMKFEHILSESARLQCKNSLLNLESSVIFVLDELADDYDRGSYFPCPRCGEAVVLEETISDDIGDGIDKIIAEEGVEGERFSSTSVV